MVRATSRGPSRSRSSPLSQRFSSLSLSSLPRIFFVPAPTTVSLSGLLARSSSRASASLPTSTSPVSLSLSLSNLLVLSTRCVYAVNGQAWSTDPRMPAAAGFYSLRVPRHPLPSAFLSAVSLPFRTDLPFSSSLSAKRSLRRAPTASVLRHPTRKGGRVEG